MPSLFSSQFFAKNRTHLRASIDEPLIVLTANGLLQRGADSTYAFAQDANFWYLTGIDEPDILLVLNGEQEYLIVPPRSSSRETFDGSVSFEALSARSGIAEVYDAEAGAELLKAAVTQTATVAMPGVPPAYVEHYGMYTNPARANLLETLKGYNATIGVRDISLELARMRMIKQPAELSAIQAAIDITAAGIEQVLKTSKDTTFAYEYEIEALLTGEFRRQKSAHAFEPIVAAGKRACTLHNVANEGAIGAGDLIVMDIGAEVEHYAADITRTVSLGKTTPRQRAVHEKVLEAQEYAKGLLKPGVTMHEYERQIEHFMGEKLRELGLIKTIDHDSVRKYYPHATSHFLGLNVHDAGDYEQPLQAGTVLTVEPGIYIPEESIGIRIEDDVLITDNGIRVLSEALPRELP